MEQTYVLDAVPVGGMERVPSEFEKSLPFYLLRCSYFKAGSKYYTERSGMDNFLILYTVAGEGELEYDGKYFLLKPGTAAMIDCRQHQIYRTGANGKWEFYWAHLNGSGVLLYYRTMFESKFFVPFAGDGLKEVFDCMFAIRPEYTVAHALRLSLVLHELLEGIAEAAAEKMPEVVHTAVRQAAQYLADHYSEDVSVAQLAGIMNFSQYHFIRIFKQGMGETPHEFLTRCRINASKKLLLQNLSLEEVAGKVGYHDVNIYIRAFKKLTGTTPHRFRRGIK